MNKACPSPVDIPAAGEPLPKKLAFLNLFLVSIYLIAFETSLSRYFAITIGSEYGYLIISIVMVGMSLSGVLLSLFEDFFCRYRRGLLFILPLLLIVSTIAGMVLITHNDFNPLELQHEVLYKNQLFNIFEFYLTLIPVFFFAGLFIGINFVAFHREISKVYAYNLLGSAAGALLVLVAMFFIHPFHLLAAIIPCLFVPSLLSLAIYYRRWSKPVFISAAIIMLAAFAVCQGFVTKHQFGKFPYFKPIYASLNIQGNKVVREKISPAGYYIILDNLSEFDNIDASNNYDTLHSASPPRSYGIYKDGAHILSLMKENPQDLSYMIGALDSFPYLLKPNPQALIVGTAGGYRIREAQYFKPSLLVALEPDPVVYQLIRHNPAVENALKNTSIQFSESSPFSLLARTNDKFDIIDLSSDLLIQNPDGVFLFTVEAVKKYLTAINPGGIVSIEIPISEFSVYALKMFQTIRAALHAQGFSDPERHMIVYRSSWTAQFLVSNQPFDRATIEKLRKFCSDRSFDTSYYPGIDPQKVEIWNDLPALSFEDQSESVSEKASDSLMIEMLDLLGAGQGEEKFFNLAPSTIDRPNFFSVLRLAKLDKIVRHLSIIPPEEIGNIINVIVISQAVIFAVIILVLPFIRVHRIPSPKLFFRTAVYFASLGLAFLFIEIALINRLSFFLNDATSSFAFVLTGMLVFSGIGSWFSSNHVRDPARGLKKQVALIIVMLLIYILFLPRIIDLAIDLPFALKGMLIIVLIAPISFAMGYFFPLGLSSLETNTAFLLPWAWAINGSFSVISTPFANLLALRFGYILVFAASALLYAIAFLSFPNPKTKT